LATGDLVSTYTAAFCQLQFEKIILDTKYQKSYKYNLFYGHWSVLCQIFAAKLAAVSGLIITKLNVLGIRRTSFEFVGNGPSPKADVAYRIQTWFKKPSFKTLQYCTGSNGTRMQDCNMLQRFGPDGAGLSHHDQEGGREWETKWLVSQPPCLSVSAWLMEKVGTDHDAEHSHHPPKQDFGTAVLPTPKEILRTA
jgi:hypothetical protein